MDFSQAVKSYKQSGDIQLLEFFGGVVLNGPTVQEIANPTYGTVVAINAAAGAVQLITITDGVAFAVSAPTNPPAAGYSQSLTLIFRNSSGGAHGAITLDAAFLTAAGIPAIANGKSRSYLFNWDGAKWVLAFSSAADVAN